MYSLVKPHDSHYLARMMWANSATGENMIHISWNGCGSKLRSILAQYYMQCYNDRQFRPTLFFYNVCQSTSGGYH
jgi:hypothetical protein